MNSKHIYYTKKQVVNGDAILILIEIENSVNFICHPFKHDGILLFYNLVLGSPQQLVYCL